MPGQGTATGLRSRCVYRGSWDAALLGATASHCRPRLGRLWGVHCCPELGKTRGGHVVDSGYRMFNWPRSKWTAAFSSMTEQQRGHQEERSPAVLRLPVFWCAEPAHAGARNVFVLPLDEGPSALDELRSAGEVVRLPEPEFQAMMDVWKRWQYPAAMERSSP